jgi:mono/diheme cytochrome c family protein
MQAMNFRPVRLLAVLLAGWLAAGASLAADPAVGARLYASHCAACHGVRGAPLMPGAPDFRRIETLLRPDAQLLRSIRNGQRAMPAYFGVLKDSEILDVIAHLRTLN